MEARDVGGVAEVSVAAWKAAYRGLLPTDYLEQLTAASRVQAWRTALERPVRPGGLRVVSEDEHGSVSAFLASGPAHAETEAGTTGQVYVLNVDPAQWGKGHGTALMTEALRSFDVAGFASAVLWVHPANARARRFYERLGWRNDQEQREQEVFGVLFPELRYRREI